MSEMLIGDMVKEDAYERLRSNLNYNSKGFLQRVKNLFLETFHSDGMITNEIFIPAKNLENYLGEKVGMVRMLAKFVGIVFFDFDARKKTIELQANNPNFDVLCDEGYTLVIPAYKEGTEKTAAQVMLEQAIKEYQEQSRNDEAYAEEICKTVLEKLSKKDYSVKLLYEWNRLEITIVVKYNKAIAYRYAWKVTVKEIMYQNGFDLETLSIYYEDNQWIIHYPMTE